MKESQRTQAKGPRARGRDKNAIGPPPKAKEQFLAKMFKATHERQSAYPPSGVGCTYEKPREEAPLSHH